MKPNDLVKIQLDHDEDYHAGIFVKIQDGCFGIIEKHDWITWYELKSIRSIENFGKVGE